MLCGRILYHICHWITLSLMVMVFAEPYTHSMHDALLTMRAMQRHVSPARSVIILKWVGFSRNSCPPQFHRIRFTLNS